MNNEQERPEDSQQQLDKAMHRLKLIMHCNLEHAKNKREGTTSELEAELQAELDALRANDAGEDAATLKRLTSERRQRLGLPPEE